MKFNLVMTASINPNGMQGLSPESLSNREEQYRDTLRFYTQQPSIARILFVENSAWDLSRLKQEVDCPRVTWLSLDENNFPRAWGKGYGEFLLLDRAVDYMEQAWTSGNGGGQFIKVTGRFPILNIETLLREFASRDPLQLAVDVIDHPLYDWLHLGWDAHHARTILYAVTIDFYKANIYGRFREIPNQFPDAEALMFDVWKRSASRQLGVYGRFRHEPRLAGFAGHSGTEGLISVKNYDGIVSKIKRAIRQSCRYLLPWFKI